MKKPPKRPPLSFAEDLIPDDDADDLDDDLEDLDDEWYDLLDEDFDLTASVVSLTVAESKRLIAKGIVSHPLVASALEKGTVVVCKGTTNAYVVEELLGQKIDKGKYVLGRTVPEGDKAAQRAFKGSMPEVILKDGEPVTGLTLAEAVKDLKPRDVILKGANALDYAAGVAGVLVGHPEGGTLGTIMGAVYGKGAHLIIPVGLEKQVSVPLKTLTRLLPPALLASVDVPRFWPLHGEVFTEIEALSVLADVNAVQMGAGGVCGAEGAVWLLLTGPQECMDAAQEVIDSLRGEPSFLDAAK